MRLIRLQPAPPKVILMDALHSFLNTLFWQAAAFQYLDAQRLPRGPVTLDERTALAIEGRVQDDTLCQRVGQTAWVMYDRLCPSTQAQR